MLQSLPCLCRFELPQDPPSDGDQGLASLQISLKSWIKETILFFFFHLLPLLPLLLSLPLTSNHPQSLLPLILIISSHSTVPDEPVDQSRLSWYAHQWRHRRRHRRGSECNDSDRLGSHLTVAFRVPGGGGGSSGSHPRPDPEPDHQPGAVRDSDPQVHVPIP